MDTKWKREGAELLAEIRNKELAADETALWYIGQVGYVIRHGGTLLMIDPVLNDMTDEDGNSRRHYREPFTAKEAASLEVNYVICTHGHADHLAPETIYGFLHAEKTPTFIVPAGCRALMSELGASDADVVYLTDGQCFEAEDLRVTAVSAAHPTHISDPDDPAMALGYEIMLGRHRMIHLGDTYLTEKLYRTLMEITEPDLVLFPINGDDLFRRMRDCIGNMEAEEAAKLAVRMNARLAVPTHYDMVIENTVDPERFAAEMERLGAAERCRIPELGECLVLK